MKKLQYFLLTFCAVLILTAAGFFLAVNYCGRGVTDQPWFRDLSPMKNYLAKTKKAPKIVIIGGSSSLFGIDGEKLCLYTGMDCINFSMSIMIPMRFYLLELDQYVRAGDIVVLPLELTNHYLETEEKLFSQFGISLLFGCHPETQKTLSFREWCSLYFQYGFSWINTSLFHPCGPLRRARGDSLPKQGIFDGVCKEEVIAAEWASLHGKRNKHNAPDHRYDISSCGDWLVDLPSAPCATPAFGLPNGVSNEFLFSYRKIRELVESRHATLLLVWPNCYFYAEQSGFAEFADLLKSHGVLIHGRPEASAFPKFFYHDPFSHMNQSGAELWTMELAKTIGRATGRQVKKIPDWPYAVFADDPAGFFPGVAEAKVYATGVMIPCKNFTLSLNIPEALRGKELELNLIVRPNSPQGKFFREIRVSGKELEVQELMYSERAEITFRIPAENTRRNKLELQCSVNGPRIGMERSFLREFPGPQNP